MTTYALLRYFTGKMVSRLRKHSESGTSITDSPILFQLVVCRSKRKGKKRALAMLVNRATERRLG
jgi:hypothetical protein